MTLRRVGFAALLLIAVLGSMAAGYWYLHREAAPVSEAESSESEVAPVAKVKVIPLRTGQVSETLTAFGGVEAAPGETQTFSVPFECRVIRVLVVNGQQVEADQPLAEVEASPETRLGLDQARQERDAAKNQLTLARQRLEMKLATKQDLLQAEQALAAAELRVGSLERRGIDGKQTIRASGQGIVSRIDVQQGQIVPAGEALVATIRETQIVVRLGVESEDVKRLHSGQAVRLEPVNGSHEAVAGKIHRITREVNPQTRLVGVYVAPAPESHLLLNEYVRGRIVVASKEGLLVPSEAALPEDETHVLYTIDNGHAVKHEVKIGLQGEGQVEVLGPDLRVGQQVVVVGNSQLEDGMAVEVEQGP